MEEYFQVFVNFKSNDWARPLPLAEFAYNIVKNINTGHISFELNCGYNLCILYEKDNDSQDRPKIVNKLSAKLRKLMIVCWENLYYAQELQKKLTIREASLEVMPSVIKFGWITNISRSSITKSLSYSFLGRFRCFILSESKFIS